MPNRTYLFIDGEYLRQRHREAMREFFGVDGDLEVSALMHQAQASRAYFYDSLDDAPRPGETGEACQARIAPLEQFFASVRALSGFHVQLGTVSQGKRRQQKEVDILLAVDMLTHGFDRNMEKAVLVAGDLDFRPIVEALVRRGVFVEVWYHRSSIAQDLPGAADFGHEIRLRQFHSWNTEAFRDAHRLPMVYEHAGGPAGELLRTGTVWEWPVELRRLGAPPGDVWFNLWITVAPGDTLRIYDNDQDLVERYVANQFEPIKWSVQAERNPGEGEK
jgi:uncharacterized LabA/DUF88 family protein